MEKTSARKRVPIKQKTFRGIIAAALLIFLMVSIPICFGVSVLEYHMFDKETCRYARILAESIDGDKALECLATGETDRYYKGNERLMTTVVEEVELYSASVMIPKEDGLVFIWDVSVNDAPYAPGTLVPYGADKEVLLQAFSKEPVEEVFLGENQHGQKVSCAYYPVFDDREEPVAIAAVERPSPNVMKVPAQFFMLILVCTALVALLMMVIIYAVIRKNLIKPIRTLTESAEKIVSNLEREETIDIDVNTNDELEDLADAFMEMDLDLRKYIKELSEITSERERFSAELELASKIQMGMLPELKEPFIDNDRFELFASMLPAKVVGGDFYDFFMVDDKHIALLIADVSGKGVPAALYTLVTKTLIKNSIKAGMSPSEALASVNNTMMESNKIQFFVTVWLAVIDLETGQGTAVNAGHEHPFLMHQNGEFEQVKYRHAMPLASFEGLKFPEHIFTIEPGDTILVHTDGVTEAINKDDEFFGEKRLLTVLNDNRDGSPEDLLQAVSQSIHSFAGNTSQFDDETMLGFRYKGWS